MTLDAGSLEHTVELLDRTFNEGDLDAVLSFYEDAGSWKALIDNPFGPLVLDAE